MNPNLSIDACRLEMTKGVLIGSDSDDDIESTESNDTVLSGHGDDAVSTGDSSDVVLSGNGDDTIDAGDGDDVVLSGHGDDVINAGSGDDVVMAGSGNDFVLHIEAENLDSQGFYKGGWGRDTVRLIISEATFASAAFQAKLAVLQGMIAQNGTASGTFASIGVEIRSFEVIEFVVEDDYNNAPTGSVLINGAAEQDQVLTADASGLADADGLGTFWCQWRRSTDGGATFEEITGDTAVDYTLGDSDVGALVPLAFTHTMALILLAAPTLRTYSQARSHWTTMSRWPANSPTMAVRSKRSRSSWTPRTRPSTRRPQTITAWFP